MKKLLVCAAIVSWCYAVSGNGSGIGNSAHPCDTSAETYGLMRNVDDARREVLKVIQQLKEGPGPDGSKVAAELVALGNNRRIALRDARNAIERCNNVCGRSYCAWAKDELERSIHGANVALLDLWGQLDIYEGRSSSKLKQ